MNELTEEIKVKKEKNRSEVAVRWTVGTYRKWTEAQDSSKFCSHARTRTHNNTWA